MYSRLTVQINFHRDKEKERERERGRRGGRGQRRERELGVYFASPYLNITADGLKIVPVSNYTDIEQRMEEGTQNRTVASTNMNATSRWVTPTNPASAQYYICYSVFWLPYLYWQNKKVSIVQAKLMFFQIIKVLGHSSLNFILFLISVEPTPLLELLSPRNSKMLQEKTPLKRLLLTW